LNCVLGGLKISSKFEHLSDFAAVRKQTQSTELKKEKERKIETEILYWFLSQPESTSSPLALSREFTIITKDYKLLKHTARDFQCSSKHLQEIYYAQAQKQNTSYKFTQRNK
jgi:hypothetical protein